MDIIAILWQLGVLSAILVFGLKIGLASGLAHFSKKALAVIVISYGIGVLIITTIASFYSSQITGIMYTYNSGFFLIMAAIMIISGVLTIREWKIHEKNTSKPAAIAIIAPCPCCFLSIVVSILIVAPTIGLTPFNLSQYAALALMIIIIASYFGANLFNKLVKKPYPVVLGNFMFFLGLYFLVSSLILPNISSVLAKPMGNISIESTSSLILALLLFLGLIVLGRIINKKISYLNN